MENKKTLVNYILILSGILIVILLTIFFLSNRSLNSYKSDKTSKSNLSSPTLSPYSLNLKNQKIPYAFNLSSPSPSSSSSSPSLSLILAASFTGVKEVEVDTKIAAEANQSFELKKQLPLKKGNLKIDFDYEKEVFVISPINDQISISDQEKEEFFNWLKENHPIIKKKSIIYSNTPFSIKSTPKNFDIKPIIPSSSSSYKISSSPQINKQSLFIYLLSQAFNLVTITPSLPVNNQTSISISPTLIFLSENNNQQKVTTTPFLKNESPGIFNKNSYVYYSQVGKPFGDYPLPKGCKISDAGCGPTTVAMIVASYKDKSVNPITTVNQYGSRVGCAGSSYLDAINVLRSYDINVGSLIFSTGYYDGKKAEEIAPELKKYISAGKTIFVLANFRADGGGHFFWIVDIDEKNNLWAFDPYYGRYQIPYNENSRYPYPLYRLAFPVSP